MTDSWDDLATWWIDAVRDDPAQSTDTHEVLREILRGEPAPTGLTLDLGCGEGQTMRWLGSGSGLVVGADLSRDLLSVARRWGPVVCAAAPALGWLRSGSVDRIVSVGLLDLLADADAFLRETARVTRPGGCLGVVINHPVATSPHSSAVADPDGEVYWRWGAYLTAGNWPQIVADGRSVELFHRPLGELLSVAAAAGWRLELMVERGPSAATILRYPELSGQEHVPTIAGLRWRHP